MVLADRPAGITLSRQTMAPVCLLRLPRWPARANTCTNRPTTTRCTAPWPCWAKRSWHLDDGEKIMLTGRDELRNRKRARAAFRCTALIAVITAVNASHSERSDSTRPCTHHLHPCTVGTICVKIMVTLLEVNEVINGHYA